MERRAEYAALDGIYLIEAEAPEGVTPIAGEGISELSPEVALQKLLSEGKATLISGLSLIGMADICSTVAIIRAANIVNGESTQVEGWSFYANHPSKKFKKPVYINSEDGKNSALALPNSEPTFVAEVDPEILSKDIDPKRLREILDYAVLKSIPPTIVE